MITKPVFRVVTDIYYHYFSLYPFDEPAVRWVAAAQWKRWVMLFKYHRIYSTTWLAVLWVVFTGCATVDVKGLIASGQLNQAKVQCDQLTGPQRKDCFNQLSQAYLDAQDFESAVRYHTKANQDVVFLETFDDNRNGWFETDNAEIFRKVQNHQYIFAHKRDKGNWYSWPKKKIELNEDQDFSIETVVTKLDGIDDHGYELVWGARDVKHNFAFGISGNGHYRYSKYKDGKWESLTKWTPTDAIHKFNTTNKLTVQKNGDVIRFSINDQQVLEKPYERSFGSKVGICLNQRMKVAINRLIITQQPTENEAARTLLEGYLLKGNTLGFITHCEKAGYTKNEAYVRVADIHMANGDYEAAAIHLERAGWSVKDPKKSVLLNEQFDDNNNKWFEKDDAEVFYKVQNGQYHFHHKREKGGWFSWPKIIVNIDSSGDFRIESTMTKISGVNDRTYDIFWAMKDNRNYFSFGINGNGSYLYGKYVQGQWKALIDWTPSTQINRGNLTNSLAVEKSGDKIKFYVNDHLVDERPYQKGLGKRIGFILNGPMAVEIDNLTVVQNAPQIAHALAIKYVPRNASGDKAVDQRKDLRREMGPVETSTKR